MGEGVRKAIKVWVWGVGTLENLCCHSEEYLHAMELNLTGYFRITITLLYKQKRKQNKKKNKTKQNKKQTNWRNSNI